MHALKAAAAAGLFAAIGLSGAAQAPDAGDLSAQLDRGRRERRLRRSAPGGLLQEAGLDVTIDQGNGSGNTAQTRRQRQAQLAYADAVAVSQLVAKGAPMRVVSHLPVQPERADRPSRPPASSPSPT